MRTQNSERRSKTLLAVIAAAALLLVAAPTLAQPSLLDDVRAERAKYGASLTPGQVAQMLNAVAWRHRAEGWGMLRKGSGNSCPLGDMFISCDILIHAPSVRHFDVLIDAEGRAEPTWGDVGPCVLGPASGCEMSRFLAPVDPGGAPPTPVPTTGPTPAAPPVVVAAAVDYGRLEAYIRDQVQQVIDQNERIRADELARDAQTLAAVQGVSAQVKQHDEAPTFVGKLFGNRYTQILMGAAAAWFTAQQTSK